MKLYTNTNRILSTLMASTMTLSLLATTSSATEAPLLTQMSAMTLSETINAPVSFTDVPTSHWGYQYVTDAAALKLVSGYENGSFKPEQAMTVGEFLVMMTNTYPELKELSQDSVADYYVKGEWYSPYVYAAHKSGLFPVGMNPTADDMTKGITREEASYIVYTAMTKLGGESNGNKTFPTGNIKDYTSISDGKREAVTQLYLFGIIGGTSIDTQGFSTFSPKSELTRAQLCVIMLALNEPDRRSPASTDQLADHSGVQYGPNGEQIIQEGQSYERPMAQEGDIVVKADGTQVVLKKDPETGVLGWGQGVAADLGLISPEGDEITDNKALHWSGATDSLGNSVTNQKFHVNLLTGEGFWAQELMMYTTTIPRTDEPIGTLSDDLNWISAGNGEWFSCFSNDITWEKVEELKAMN